MKTKNIAILLFIYTLLTACSDELDKVLPRNQIPQEELTPEDIEKVMTGVYAKMEDFTFKLWFDHDMRGENYKAGPGGSLTDPVSMSPENNAIGQEWQMAFTSLSQVNFLIESYEANPQSAQLGCTAYYFRALIYYNLVTRWGGVPILHKRTNDVAPISPEAKVWEFVVEDIERALALNATKTDRFYVSKAAVQALAARIYLATGDKTRASDLAKQVIDNPAYTLATTSEEFGLPYASGTTSKEVIFALANKRTASYLTFIGSLNDVDASWNYAPTNELYNNLFADDVVTNRVGDIRLAATFSASDANRVIKFPNGIAGQQIVATENYANTPIVISRMAEMYLIAAETLGKTNGATLLVDFLKTRYLTYPVVADIQSLSDIAYQNLILNERRREFYGEGYWWYDVKRTGRTDLFTTLNGRGWLMYYPVPQAERDLAGHNNYPQNEGY